LSSTATPRLAQRQEQVAHVGPAERVEGARRLVEDDELRARDERHGHAEALLHALGEAADPVAGAGARADELQALALLRAVDVHRRGRTCSASTSLAVSHGW
jgi:hypothetical protein